jgi:hypothetical protein
MNETAFTLSRLILALASITLIYGCDDQSPNQEGVLLLVADASVVPTVDLAVDGADPSPSVDSGGTPPLLDAPQARLYRNNPVTDEGQLTQVTLTPPTADDGRLTSQWVEVFNCLNEEGGQTAMPDLGGFMISISLCHEVQTVRPDPDGHYLSIVPPDTDSDPNDQFSELMMYHHVNRVHDYFKGTHGFTDLDYPLPALVNVQVKTDPPLPFLNPGPDGWIGLENAAFFPKEAWRQFAASFGLPPRDSDSIIFFQGGKDFAYDSPVIYHEYTHAVIGTSRLSVPAVLDEYGLDLSPRSMNEGLADFFAASLSGDPVIGNYVGTMGLGLRDLSQFRACPQHTIDEVHAQGEIIGSTLWALREIIGAEVAEAITYLALEQFTFGTNHTRAAALILAAAADIGPEVEGQTRLIFEDHGFLECERSLPFEFFRAQISGLPHLVEGTQTSGLAGLNGGVPAFKQFHIDTQMDTAAIELRWSVSAGGQGGLGGLGGGGGQPAPLDLMLRHGSPINITTAGGLTFAHDHRLSIPLNGEQQRVILTGNCLPQEPGRIHTLFLNTSSSQLQITSMDSEVLTGIAPNSPIQTCGAEEPMPSPDQGVAPKPTPGQPMPR